MLLGLTFNNFEDDGLFFLFLGMLEVLVCFVALLKNTLESYC